MDARFVKVWEDVSERRARGEGLADILDRLSLDELVALLAATPKGEPVLGNVVATALLNRLRRLRASAWLLLGLALGLVLYLVDGIYTGTWLDINGGPVAVAIAVVSLAIVTGALVALFLVQRDHLRGRRAGF